MITTSQVKVSERSNTSLTPTSNEVYQNLNIILPMQFTSYYEWIGIALLVVIMYVTMDGINVDSLSKYLFLKVVNIFLIFD